MIINIPVEVPDWVEWVVHHHTGWWSLHSDEPFIYKGRSRIHKNAKHHVLYIHTRPPDGETDIIYKIENGELVRVEG